MYRDATQSPAHQLPPAAQTAWDNVIVNVLAHGAETGTALERVLVEVPDFALGRAVAGLLALSLAKRELVAHAWSHLTIARQHAAGPHQVREKHYIDALACWLDGRPLAAADLLEGVLDTQSGDILAFKLAQGIRFMAGDRKGMLRACQARADGVSTSPSFAGFAAGCTAFALEESGNYAQAERFGRHAIALEPRDAWGRHAVAHVMEMTGRFRDGIAFLQPAAQTWTHCGNFSGHLFWHLALFQLETGAYETVLTHYDERIRVARTDDFRDLANAVSLLMRLELAGVDVGTRWEELGEIAERRATDRCLSFADLHYLIALLRAGRHNAAGRLVEDLMTGVGRDGHDKAVACGIAARLASGIMAEAMGDHVAAAAQIGAARRAMLAIGGSNAQRDLFEQIYLNSLVGGGGFAEAETVLRRRTAERQGRNALAGRLLGQITSHKRTRRAKLASASRPQAGSHLDLALSA